MRDAYQIRRVIWPQDLVVSHLSGERIPYPQYYVEHINTGCVMSIKEYQKIRKDQVESEFCEPYPEDSYMNNYYDEIEDYIVNDFADSLDHMRREDIVGKDAIPGHQWKVVDGELIQVDDK